MRLSNVILPIISKAMKVEGDGEDACLSVKRLDRRNRSDLMESMTPCHNAQVMRPYWVSSPVHQTLLAENSGDYAIALQQL